MSEHQVEQFYVSMNDLLPMCRGQGGDALAGDMSKLVLRDCSILKFSQRLSLDQFHDEVHLIVVGQYIM